MLSSTESRHQLSPIALFAYNRPEHVLKTLQSLKNAVGSYESKLFIFCDGPRTPNDNRLTDEVRIAVRSQRWCEHVEVFEEPQNKGLARSIIEGVTRLCRDFGRVIILEDDLILSPDFLRFMNSCLDYYADRHDVLHVSGYIHPVQTFRGLDSTLLLPLTSSWGWATWHRAWANFDPDCTGAIELKKDPSVRRQFDLRGSYPYSRMLFQQLKGHTDSWAIRWYWTLFRLNALGVFPPETLVVNDGFDGSGTHGWRTAGQEFQSPCDHAPSQLSDQRVDDEKWNELLKHIRRQRSSLSRITNRLKSILQIQPPKSRKYSK